MNSLSAYGPVDTRKSPYTRLVSLPGNSVRITKGFWAEFQANNHKNSLYHAYAMLEKAGNFHNFRLAAGKTSGVYRGRNFIDSDVYKWLEAVGWELGQRPDDDLRKKANEAIGLIEAAQCEDGYLNCYVQTVKSPCRWEDMDHGHELYCAGHLFQAGVAHYRSLGDRRLLDVSIRFADLICLTFGPGKEERTCGHPIVEMALIELYRTTGKACYLETAQCFIDRRGKNKMAGFAAYGPEYHQDHVTVREAQAAEGHAVRQLYLESGVTDLYLETGEQALFSSLQRIWSSIAEKKLYITGGLGSRFDGEAFGDPYELPSDQCYCETCASIAFIQWNWRMLLVTGDSRYADMIERSLFNTMLASPALDGRHFFYANPLFVRDGRYTRLSQNPPDGNPVNGRPEWHSVACCPPNVMRTISSLEHYMITRSERDIQVHQFASMEVSLGTAGKDRVVLTMETDYPRSGNIRLMINEIDGFEGCISLRRPDWCSSVLVIINGERERVLATENGYIKIARDWNAGDVIEMDLSMEPVFMESNPRVDATRSSVCIQYGPIVYCLENHDQKDNSSLLDVRIDTRKPIKPVWRENLLGGLLTMELPGYVVQMEPWENRLYLPVSRVSGLGRKEIKLVAIPYYAWGNRGISSMRVWVPKAD